MARPKGKYKEVICVETGEVYPSVNALCEAIGVAQTTFAYRMPFGDPINGRHYRYGKTYYYTNTGEKREVFT